MRHVIFGGDGFVGRHLAPKLITDGHEVVVADISRSDVYLADEMFVCGTAAEISAVNSVDDREIPCPGPITTAIAAEYADMVRGKVDRYKDWVEHV